MINKENIDVAIVILGNEINNNLDLANTGNDLFGRLCEARGMLDVLSQKLKKVMKNESRTKNKGS